MENIDNCISRVWECEQEILDVIDRICASNNLHYSLIFGTLLGAVRHGGFIPWDDDIDIIMPREDYEKFISAWSSNPVKGYVLQNKRVAPDFTQNFTKIRKDNTTFIQTEKEKEVEYHKGIFVDIFPADRVAPEGFSRKLQYFASAINLLYSRGHTSGHGGIIGIIEKILLLVPVKSQMKIYLYTEKIISRWNNTSNEWFSPNTFDVCKRYFPKSTFDTFDTISFNGKKYSCVRDKEKLLSVIYGDYMKLPPVEDRVWKHHPILIDFDHNFEEVIHK